MTSTPARFALGDAVTFSDTVAKSFSDGEVTRNAPSFATGIVVGARTLMDHEFRPGSEPSLPLALRPLISKPTMLTFPKKGTARRAWLVSFDLYRKPVLVLDDQAFAEGETPTVVTQPRERVAA